MKKSNIFHRVAGRGVFEAHIDKRETSSDSIATSLYMENLVLVKLASRRKVSA